MDCPRCETPVCSRMIYSEYFAGAGRISGLECWHCARCGMDIMDPDQIRRGHELVSAARRAHRINGPTIAAWCTDPPSLTTIG
jgi:hypothetical protein